MASDANATYARPAGKNAPKTRNYTMIQAFEWYSAGQGVHWNLLKSMAPSLSSMGITAMWIPPPTKASGEESVGYDIYDTWDLGDFDQKAGVRTKYGTKAELKDAVATAYEHDIVTYIDTVLNHKFGADAVENFDATPVDRNDRTRPIGPMHEIQGWTKFDYEKRDNKYSGMKWNFNHFTGVDWDEKTKTSSIYKIQGIGKDWAQHVDTENKNYDYLMGADIDHRHPEVSNDLLAWATWIVKELGDGVAGFRFDAVKHIERDFISKIVQHARANSRKGSLFAVGEYWKNSESDLSDYLSGLGTQFSVFDVPLHYNFSQAAKNGSNFDMRKIWDGSLVQYRPVDAVTLVDNHDTQIGQSLASWVDPWFKPLAYALILLREKGYPCVFWGDLVGCAGDNPQQPVTQLADLIRCRKLFSFGPTNDYFDHGNCVGWARSGDDDHDGCAVVLCNSSSEGTKWMDVGKEHRGEVWTDVLRWHPGAVTVNDVGWGEFRCSAGSVSVWAKVDARGREDFIPPAIIRARL